MLDIRQIREGLKVLDHKKRVVRVERVLDFPPENTRIHISLNATIMREIPLRKFLDEYTMVEQNAG